MSNSLEMKAPFILFTDCITVKGVNRSTILDLTRGVYYLIPNDLWSILNKEQGNTIEEIIIKYGTQNEDIVLGYFEFLTKRELIFFNSNKNLFPKINLKNWDIPSTIYQAIIDFKENFDCINFDVFHSLASLGCKYIQLRFYKNVNINEITEILENTVGLNILGIDLILKKHDGLSISELKRINKFLNVNNIFFYNANELKNDQSFDTKSPFNIYSFKDDISSHKQCGNISSSYFNVNLSNVSNSIKNNSCLNKKISIDSDGNIKNCPSMTESFGNIKTTRLESVVKNEKFRKYWSISKDKIDVCKTCEFRYICTDCRAYIEQPNDLYSKPLKCGYDPKTNVWDKWSTNPLKKRAIDYYKLNDI